MNRKVVLTTALMMLLTLCYHAHGESLGWRVVNAKIRSEFPAVKRISTAELAEWLNDSTRAQPVLLDVRTRPEFDVSHLRGARHVAPEAEASVIRVPKDRPVVTYCSVGYRSGRFAECLRAAGFSNVANLEGSIFRWANEGRELVRDGRKVDKVHPYNRAWGLLLERSRRAADAELSQQ